MKDKKIMGRAGRFYRLTPKALEFIKAFKTWCRERGISEEDIPRLLTVASIVEKTPEGYDILTTIENLAKKGYLKEEETQSDLI